MITFIKNLLTPLIVVGLTTSVVSAADFYFRTDAASSDPTTLANWAAQNGDAQSALPVAGDNVHIHAGSTVDIATSVSYNQFRTGMMYNGSSTGFGPEPSGETNVNVNSGGTLNTTQNLFSGMTWNRDAGPGQAKITINSGGAVNVGSNVIIGNLYNQQNTSTVTGEIVVAGGALTGNAVNIGHKNNQNSTGVSTGTLTINSGTADFTGAVTMGHSDDSVGTLTLNGGKITAQGLTFGAKDLSGSNPHEYTNQSATMNLFGGEFHLIQAGWVNWQEEVTTSRTLNIGAGILTAANQLTSGGTYNAKLGTIRNLINYLIDNTNGNQSISIAATAKTAEEHSALLATYSNGSGGSTEEFEIAGQGTIYLGSDGNLTESGQTALWAVAVPEPSSYALIAGCLAMTAIMLRRRI
jgi:hypothetical protein